MDVSIVTSCHVYTAVPFSHACLIDQIPGRTREVTSHKHKDIVLNVLHCIGGMPEQSGLSVDQHWLYTPSDIVFVSHFPAVYVAALE